MNEILSHLKGEIDALLCEQYSQVFTYKNKHSTLAFRLVRNLNNEILIAMPSPQSTPHNAELVDGILTIYDQEIQTSLYFGIYKAFPKLASCNVIDIKTSDGLQNFLSVLDGIDNKTLINILIKEPNLSSEY